MKYRVIKRLIYPQLKCLLRVTLELYFSIVLIQISADKEPYLTGTLNSAHTSDSSTYEHKQTGSHTSLTRNIQGWVFFPHKLCPVQ